MKLPGLVGMLLAGIIIGPYLLNFISPEMVTVSGDFRKIALIVILLRAGFERAIPWAWSVNGCASVAGSVLAAVVAVSWGFTAVLLLASLCYSLGLAVLIVQNLSHHRHKDYSQ